MSFVPNLSTVTGDSKTLCGVLEAETTTSSRAVLSSKTIFTVELPVISTVAGLKPTLLASILNGASISTVIV